VVSLFGSDVYRMTGALKPLQARLLARAFRITAANQDTLEAAREQYGVEPARGVIVRFGLRPLEHIDRLRATGDRAALKRAMGIPEERIVVAAGYNASPHQRHQEIIDALCAIPTDQRGRLFVLVPMTMGGSSDHVARVRGMLAASGFDHRVITDLMTDEEVARLRLATDIMVQVQPTDQLAGAMQEHLYAGSVVITGAWLPYRVLSDAGVRFWTVADRSFLAKELEVCIGELSSREAACAGNDAPIRALSSWSHTGPQWSALYD
jgi:hypothetical protein